MKIGIALLLTALLLALCAWASAETSVMDDIMADLESLAEETKELAVSPVEWSVSEDKQSIFLTRPTVEGSEEYTIAYNIYDADSNPVNYFYSLEESVAATPGYGGLFNVFVVVRDTATGEQNVQNIGWQQLDWPRADQLTVGKATHEMSDDNRSVFVDRPSIACASGQVSIAYNIYDGQGNAVNYFYSTEKRVAATPGYPGRFNVFIVVTDTGTGEQNVQNIGWSDMEGEETWPAVINGVYYDLKRDTVYITGGDAGLKTLTLMDEVYGRPVEGIDTSAFASNRSNDYRKLTGPLKLPKHLKSIGYQAFAENEFTGELVIPEGVTEISSFAFFENSGLTGDLVIPDNVESIGNQAFMGCYGFTSLTLPENCEVEYSAFNDTNFVINHTWDDGWDVYSIRTVDQVYYLIDDDGDEKTCSAAGAMHGIPAINIVGEVDGVPVTSIESDAFEGHENVTGGVSFPDSLVTIGTSAFFGCKKLSGTLELPPNLQRLNLFSFASCESFSSLVLPEGLTEIPYGCFQDCIGLSGELIIPKSIQRIDSNAFKNCTGLTGTVVIPVGCTVKDTAFEGTNVTLVYEEEQEQE